MKTDWHDLIQRHIAGLTTEEESALLQDSLKRDDAVARLYLRYMNLDVALEAHTGAQAAVTEMLVSPPQVESKRWTGWLSWRPLAAAAAGIVFGMFCTSMVFGYVMPRAVATMMRVFALEDGSFEKMSGAVPSGFPKRTGVWSGDASEVVSGGAEKAKDGARMLRFVRAEGDATVPNSPAISCDVFQLVDLRSLRESGSTEGDSVLELSAEFLDARTQPRVSVTFTCQMFLFKGDPAKAHETWPLSNGDALGSGAAHLDSLGGTATSWKKLTARCLLPAHADYAVVQIAVRPNIRPTKLESLFVDDVKLTVKTQPSLPVRIVQR